MKLLLRVFPIVVVALGFTACADESTSSPSTTSTATFVATLLTSNEVPPIANGEAGGSGTARLTFNTTKDSAGNVTAATLDCSVTASGFPAGTSLTKAHIHSAAAGANGGIFVSVGLADGEVTFASGSGSFSKTGIAVTADQANAILANPGAFYFNIHTALNPDGVARGQLTRQQ